MIGTTGAHHHAQLICCDGDLIYFLPILASNWDPPDLCLLSSGDSIIITILMDNATIENLWRDIPDQYLEDTDKCGFLQGGHLGGCNETCMCPFVYTF
jgi:hypothetical protein